MLICGSWRNDRCHLNRNFYTRCKWCVCAWLSESYVLFILPSLPPHHFLDKIIICEGISVPFPTQLIPLALPIRFTWCSLSPLWCEICLQKAESSSLDTLTQSISAGLGLVSSAGLGPFHRHVVWRRILHVDVAPAPGGEIYRICA